MNECPIPCNLCGASDVEVIADRDRNGRPLRTTVCRRCGLLWSNPRPSEADVRRYYSREYRVEYKGRSTPSLRHVARSGRGALARYRELAPYLKKSARVLDVGAGGGEVVYVLRRLGVDAQGLEPDERYARHARETLDVPVATGFVQDASYAEAAFDVITMYHALEHVENPVAVLSRLREWIVENGVLIVEVPNVEARCMSPGHRFHFAHFYNFNRATLEGVGQRAGFTPLNTATSPDGGNLISAFAAGGRPVTVAIDPRNYSRVASMTRGHTALKYYGSSGPYVAPFGRLRTYLADRKVTSGCRTPRQVLDRLIEGSGEHL